MLQEHKLKLKIATKTPRNMRWKPPECFPNAAFRLTSVHNYQKRVTEWESCHFQCQLIQESTKVIIWLEPFLGPLLSSLIPLSHEESPHTCWYNNMYGKEILIQKMFKSIEFERLNRCRLAALFLLSTVVTYPVSMNDLTLTSGLW
jgi:hypothetical protein